jgi:hypothetical protein
MLAVHEKRFENGVSLVLKKPCHDHSDQGRPSRQHSCLATRVEVYAVPTTHKLHDVPSCWRLQHAPALSPLASAVVAASRRLAVCLQSSTLCC